MTDKEKFDGWFSPIEEDMRQRGCGLSAVAGVYADMWQAWQAALASQQPADDGWIEWTGGECPVGGEKIVEVKLRAGCGYQGWPAKTFDWLHTGMELDVIVYRIVAGEDQDCPECQEIQRCKERLRIGIEKSIADLMLSSRRRLAVELPELTEEDKENRILRVNLVVKP